MVPVANVGKHYTLEEMLILYGSSVYLQITERLYQHGHVWNDVCVQTKQKLLQPQDNV